MASLRRTAALRAPICSNSTQMLDSSSSRCAFNGSVDLSVRLQQKIVHFSYTTLLHRAVFYLRDGNAVLYMNKCAVKLFNSTVTCKRALPPLLLEFRRQIGVTFPPRGELLLHGVYVLLKVFEEFPQRVSGSGESLHCGAKTLHLPPRTFHTAPRAPFLK